MNENAFFTGTKQLSEEQVARIHAYWRAANYLSVGQIYLLDNPLLREPLAPRHIKPRLLGHWGTTLGLNFIYVHLNRVIKARDLDAIYICGPGHGGPGVVANVYLEATYSEIYPSVTRDVEGLRGLFRQFSFPGGIPSHAAPETPGSIHEGGELGYSLSHAYGAALDNPDLIVACVIGDGEAETGPLAAGWHCNKFLNPERDGAGAANPAPQWLQDRHLIIFGRIAKSSGKRGRLRRRTPAICSCRASPYNPAQPQRLDRAGWQFDGKRVEGFWRAHQVPIDKVRENLAYCGCWKSGCTVTGQRNCLTRRGGCFRSLRAWHRKVRDGWGQILMRMVARSKRELQLPDFRKYGVDVHEPGATQAEATRIMGAYLRDVIKLIQTTSGSTGS